jgi:hypothetical protein
MLHKVLVLPLRIHQRHSLSLPPRTEPRFAYSVNVRIRRRRRRRRRRRHHQPVDLVAGERVVGAFAMASHDKTAFHAGLATV